MSKPPRRPIRMARNTIRTASGNTALPYQAPEPERIRGTTLMNRRARLLGRYPLCCICAANGTSVPADELDHRHALEDGGPDTEGNCWGLCHECHVHKTNAEEERRAQGVKLGPPLAWLPPRPPELDRR